MGTAVFDPSALTSGGNLTDFQPVDFGGGVYGYTDSSGTFYDMSGNTIDPSELSSYGSYTVGNALTPQQFADYTFNPGNAISSSNSGGQSSLTGASSAPGLINALVQAFGTAFNTVNPPKPGTTLINPSTGKPYGVGTQVAGSGLFSNPFLLIILILGIVFITKK